LSTSDHLLERRWATPRAFRPKQVSRHALTAERRPDTGKAMVTVTHGMILKHELTGKRSIAIERDWRRAIQLSIA